MKEYMLKNLARQISQYNGKVNHLRQLGMYADPLEKKKVEKDRIKILIQLKSKYPKCPVNDFLDDIRNKEGKPVSPTTIKNKLVKVVEK